MQTFCFTTPRRFCGQVGQYTRDTTLDAVDARDAATQYALQLAATSPHPDFVRLRKDAKHRPLSCFVVDFPYEYRAYATVGFIRDDGGETCIPFDFYISPAN